MYHIPCKDTPLWKLKVCRHEGTWRMTPKTSCERILCTFPESSGLREKSWKKKARSNITWRGFSDELYFHSWIRSLTFGQISHGLGPKLNFWGNFQLILHGFALRCPTNIVFSLKTRYLIKNWPKLQQQNIKKTHIHVYIYIYTYIYIYIYALKTLIDRVTLG